MVIDEITKEADKYRKTGIFKSNENSNNKQLEETENPENEKCWSKVYGYECCDSCNVIFIDDKGKWGTMNNKWCGIDESLYKDKIPSCPQTSYPCCSHCNIEDSEEYFNWGIENGDWCMINFSC